MHPAYSVIFFTTASGAGYGLLALLGLTGIVHGPASHWWFGAISLVTALLLITAGLLSSMFHLGRPERAWRAFSQWRSSWLSREGVASVATFGPALAFAALWLQALPQPPGLLQTAGVLTVAMCAVTVFCTAKIYSSLTTIRAWCNGLVVPVYLVFAAATGAALLLLFTKIFAVPAPFAGRMAALALAAAAALKWLYWRAIDSAPRTHTIEKATGLGNLGSVRQFEAPHTGLNFVMKEMGYEVARKHALTLRSYVLSGLLFAGAAGLSSVLVAGALAMALAILCAVLALVAAAIERWLFFAEAQHVSTLYYGAKTA